MNGKVYMLVCRPTGRRYIGRTYQPLKKRLRCHKNASNNRQPAITHAVKKYGWDNFTVTVLATGIQTLLALIRTERAFIDMLNPELNCTHGDADTGAALVTDATRAKLRQRRANSNTRKLMSAAAKKNHDDPAYRKRFLSASRAAQSKRTLAVRAYNASAEGITSRVRRKQLYFYDDDADSPPGGDLYFYDPKPRPSGIKFSATACDNIARGQRARFDQMSDAQRQHFRQAISRGMAAARARAADEQGQTDILNIGAGPVTRK